MVKYFCDLTVILRLYPVFTFHKLVDKSSQFPFSFFSSTKTSGLLSDWRSRNIFLWNKETPEKIKRSGNWHPKEVWWYISTLYPLSSIHPPSLPMRIKKLMKKEQEKAETANTRSISIVLVWTILSLGGDLWCDDATPAVSTVLWAAGPAWQSNWL